jgi:hypothetical protein
MGILCDSKQYNSSSVNIEPQKSEEAQMWEQFFKDIHDSSGNVYKALEEHGFKEISESSGICRFKRRNIIIVYGSHHSITYCPRAFMVVKR